MKLFIIGYEGAALAVWLDTLEHNGVRTLVDVRLTPWSRRAEFVQSALRRALACRGIGYVHIPRLGCPAAIRNRYKATGDWDAYRAAFLGHLDTQPAALEELADLARSTTICLMCYERDASRCHRSLVADSLVRLSQGELEVVALTVPQSSGRTSKKPGGPGQLSLF